MQNDYLPTLLKLKKSFSTPSTFAYYDSKDYLRLDNNVVRNLELVESLKGNRFKNNLFSVLDKCSTAMGSRFLKRSILFPLVDLKAINERHDFIDELAKMA